MVGEKWPFYVDGCDYKLTFNLKLVPMVLCISLSRRRLCNDSCRVTTISVLLFAINVVAILKKVRKKESNKA